MKHLIALLLTLTASLAATPKCVWQTNADGTISAQNGNIVVHPSGGISGGSAASSSDFLGFEYKLSLSEPSFSRVSFALVDSPDWNYYASAVATLSIAPENPMSILRVQAAPDGGSGSEVAIYVTPGSQSDGAITHTVNGQQYVRVAPNLDAGENAPFRWRTVNPFGSNVIAEWLSDTNSVAVTGNGEITTGAAPWKLGSVIPATVQLVTDAYVQVEIGGQIVKLAIVE